MSKYCARVSKPLACAYRADSKTHKSVDIARYQIDHGGAGGICCQKLSEAEVMVAGGIEDVMISNQVTDPVRIERLAMLAQRARVLVCVDDSDNLDHLSAAAVRQGAFTTPSPDKSVRYVGKTSQAKKTPTQNAGVNTGGVCFS